MDGQSVVNYAVGQLWSFECDTGGNAPTFVIGAIEDTDVCRIIHVSVEGVKFVGPAGNLVNSAGHLPVSEDAIILSAIELLDEDVEIPKVFREGYANWREAWMNGTASYFSFPLRKILRFFEDGRWQ